MFPLQQSSERMIHFSSISNQQNRIPQENLILTHHHASVDGSTSVGSSNNIMGKGGRTKLLATSDDKNFAKPTTDQGNNKKAIHRDIERERRKQMTSLYTLLRSLIPYEFIRGKRSVSDHMNEAVNYIKHLQMRIQKLDAQRNELNKLSNLLSASSTSNNGSGSLYKCSESWVSIQPCSAGIEIVVSSSSMGQVCPLSIILQLLLGQGLILVSCITTKVNERMLYTIQSEVSDQTSTDFSQLQQKLIEAISSGIQ